MPVCCIIRSIDQKRLRYLPEINMTMPFGLVYRLCTIAHQNSKKSAYRRNCDGAAS